MTKSSYILKGRKLNKQFMFYHKEMTKCHLPMSYIHSELEKD